MQGDLQETWAGYVRGDKTITFDTGEQKWIRKIQKWKEQYPDDVIIKAQNIDPDSEDEKIDSVVVELPIKWFKVAPPAKRTLTEEQKLAARERLQTAREARKQNVT